MEVGRTIAKHKSCAINTADMPTMFNNLCEKDRKSLQNVALGLYLEGECYSFAIALHRGLGWPIVGLMKENLIWHAGVRCPDGKIHDVRGPLSEEKFGRHFLSPPYNIKEVSVDDLLKTRPVHEVLIDRARQFAENIWPELPWINSYAAKVKAFADELEKLSIKHGVWFSSTTTPAALFRGEGDEKGYEVHTSLTGGAHTIKRRLI